MKRIILPASIGLALIAFTSCEQDNRIAGCTDPFAINFNPQVQVSDDDGSCVYPKEERLGLLTDFTATWCPPCGDWGFPTFKEATDQTVGKSIAMAVHAGGSDLENPISVALNDAFGITGIPTLMANAEVDASSAGPLISAVNSFVTEKPAVSAAAIVTVDQNKGTADIVAQARWFEPMTGQATMAVYVLEDDIRNQQATSAGYVDTIHNHVLRTEASGEPFGTLVLNGEAWVGKTETVEYSINLDPAWKVENLEFVVVLWKEGVGEKVFLNAVEAVAATEL
jgi:hypothetical protein